MMWPFSVSAADALFVNGGMAMISIQPPLGSALPAHSLKKLSGLECDVCKKKSTQTNIRIYLYQQILEQMSEYIRTNKLDMNKSSNIFAQKRDVNECLKRYWYILKY